MTLMPLINISFYMKKKKDCTSRLELYFYLNKNQY